MTRHWIALPNFVDCAVFRPVQSEDEKQPLLAALGVPENSFVIGCVAAVKKDHKRIDYLIREFALFCNGNMVQGNEEAEHQGAKIIKEVAAEDGGAQEFRIVNPYHADAAPSPHPPLRALRLGVQTASAFLLIAGAKTDETSELIALAESLIPGRYKIVTDIGRAQMPDLYRAMDVFVLTSLFEMMPIALLEALASGLPCVVNKHPVLEWMIGEDVKTPDIITQLIDQGKKESEHQGAKVAKEGPTAEDGGDQNLSISSQYPAAAAPSPQSPLRSLRPSVQNSFLRGGMAIDMSNEGALALALSGVIPERVIEYGRQARERAVHLFSKEAVIGQYVEYYKAIMKD